MGLQSGLSDFAEIYCKVSSLFTIDVFMSFNKLFFVIGVLQGYKHGAQKTEVVEMDGISKFKFDLNRCLGTYLNVCNAKTRIFHLK